MNRIHRPLALILAVGLGFGCDPAPQEPPAETSKSASSAPAPAPKAPLIEWLSAPEGDVAEVALRESARAKQEKRILLVYVGASWCEPCQRFHKAAEEGQISGTLPPLRMLEFDLDRDGERLAAAGYASKLIPLFAVPGEDGRGTELRIEGSVKGPGAPANIVPRLITLLSFAKGS